MLGTTFNYNAIRSYVVAFGTLFNDIKIQRKNNAGVVAQILNVPLSYAPKERWLVRLNRDPDITDPTAISLPRMSYELISIQYAPERKLNTINRTVVSANTTFASTMFMPVPYDLTFSLYAYVKNSADGAAIVEQILPFFTPEFTLTLNNFTDFNINVDIPMILNNVNKEDVYDGGFEDRRVTVWSLDFTLKGQLYGPVQHKGIIKRAFVDFFIPSGRTTTHVGTVANTPFSDPDFASLLQEIYLQANTASRANNFYMGSTIEITGGASSGNTRTITSYDGKAQYANVSAPWTIPYPNTSSTYTIEYNISDENRTSKITSGELPAAKTVSRIHVMPGLDQFGDPVANNVGIDQLLSNTLSVSIDSIDANDDFGFIETRTFFPSANSDSGRQQNPYGDWTQSGTRRNLKTGVDE